METRSYLSLSRTRDVRVRRRRRRKDNEIFKQLIKQKTRKRFEFDPLMSQVYFATQVDKKKTLPLITNILTHSNYLLSFSSSLVFIYFRVCVCVFVYFNLFSDWPSLRGDLCYRAFLVSYNKKIPI